LDVVIAIDLEAGLLSASSLAKEEESKRSLEASKLDRLETALTEEYDAYADDTHDTSEDGGLLILPARVRPQLKTIPNVCAICFEHYKIGDSAVSSSKQPMYPSLS
jgi:hypothetical protein